MYYVKSITTGEVWLKVLKEIMNNGGTIKDGEQNLKELLNVILEIKNPLKKDSIVQQYGDEKIIDWMKDNFLKQQPVLDWGYSYGQRFFNYNGVNQIEKVIKKLKSNPESKSATISTMDPKHDDAHMPCIVAMDFKIRKNKLITTTFFRSQDAGKKIYADIISIGEISKLITRALNIKENELIIHIASLHIYETEWEKINNIISSLK